MGTEDQTANTAQSLPAVALTLVAGRGMYRANFDNSGEHSNRVIRNLGGPGERREDFLKCRREEFMAERRACSKSFQ